MLNKMGIGLTKWLCMAAMLLCLNTAGFASWGMAFAESDENIGNSLDGTTIEALTVQWITHDSTKTAAGADAPETTAEHLYLSATDNAELPMIYRIETSMSGQYNYAPGDITITIPAKVWRARTYEGTGSERAGVPDDANLLGYMEIPYPAAPSTKADFNWQLVGDNYVLTNTRTLSAATSVSIEVAIRGIRPIDIVDMSESLPITVDVEVTTHQGNTIPMTSNVLTAQVDTKAEILSAHKGGDLFEMNPGLSEKLIARLPEENKDPDDYIYVRWYTYPSKSNNQPYSLKIQDVLSDAYLVGENEELTFATKGIFLGSDDYDFVAETDGSYTINVVDHTKSTSYGYQYNQMLELWSAYRKDAFEVAAPIQEQKEYRLNNNVKWILTESDKAVDGDDRVVTSWKDSAEIIYSPIAWVRPVGAFEVSKWTHAVNRKDWTYGYALNLLENGQDVEMDFIVESTGYGYPWTTEKTKGFSYEQLNDAAINADLESLGLDASDFGKLGWTQVTEDFRTFFNFEEQELTSEDFEFRSLRISVPTKQRYAKWSDGTFAYVTDNTLPTPDLIIEYKVKGESEWRKAARATWGADGLGEFRFVDVAQNITTGAMTVFFPQNVTDVRHTFTSNVFDGKMAEHCDTAMIEWRVYPTIIMKASDRVR